MEPTIGAELEGYLVDSAGELGDTLALLGKDGWKSPDHPHEALGCDVAFCSVEAASTICRKSGWIETSLNRALSNIPQGFTAVFAPRTPYPGQIRIADKPRYKVMADALIKEHPRGYNGMLQIAPWNVLHYHIGLPDVLSVEAVLLLNVLNNIGPFARLQIVRQYGVQGEEGHLAAWTDFTKPERLPAPRWFDSVEHLVAFIEAIPKLFVQVGEEQWEIGSGQPSRLGDPISEGVLWWATRLRLSFGTIEVRWCPTLKPRFVPELGEEILKLVWRCWEFLARHRYDGTEAYKRRLYSHLCQHSYLVPAEPLTDDEWWQLFRL